MNWILAQAVKWTINCCCVVRLRQRCLWISLCRAWKVSWPRSIRAAGSQGGASAQSTLPYLTCLTLRNGTCVPGLQHHTILSFTQITSNQNLVMMRNMSHKRERLLNLQDEQASRLSVEYMLFSGTSSCMIWHLCLFSKERHLWRFYLNSMKKICGPKAMLRCCLERRRGIQFFLYTKQKC